MIRPFILLLCCAAAGCATRPAPQASASACAVHEASYACQVERYHHVSQ